MKSFTYFEKQLREERKKNPPPANTISIVPGGFSILQKMYEKANLTFFVSGTDRDKRLPVSRYGVGRQFRDWLFANYNAEVIRHDNETMIRFVDPQQMLLFILKYGA